MRVIENEHALWSVPVEERTGRPIVVFLHGRGGREDDMEVFFDALPSPYVGVSLRGGYPLRGRFSWGGEIHSEADLARALDDAALSLLRWIDENRGTAPSVGIVGWSQGGAVGLQALRIAPSIPQFVALFGSFTGGSFRAADEELAARRPPVFWGRGEVDTVIPAADVAQLAEFLSAHTTLTTAVYPGAGHEIPQQARDDLRDFLVGIRRDLSGTS